jgi:hypothetical protein
MADPPTWAGLGYKTPVYLRKLARKLSLANSVGPIDQRTAEVAQTVFLSDQSDDGYSVFRVDGDTALQRITIGYNAKRSSLRNDIEWLPITDEELAAAGITPSHTTGDTPCHFANSLHYDLPMDHDPIIKLCRSLIESKRSPISLKRNQLQTWVDLALSTGCFADRESKGCTATDCAPPVADNCQSS